MYLIGILSPRGSFWYIGLYIGPIQGSLSYFSHHCQTLHMAKWKLIHSIFRRSLVHKLKGFWHTGMSLSSSKHQKYTNPYTIGKLLMRGIQCTPYKVGYLKVMKTFSLSKSKTCLKLALLHLFQILHHSMVALVPRIMPIHNILSSDTHGAK